jgi:UDP-glucose 4-epimerase
VPVDLADRAAIGDGLRRSQAEAIIHFAAHALVGESMRDPGKYFRNNVASGLNLLDAAVECGVRKFVFSSTCAVYGLPERMPMTEDLPLRPVNPYGESKLMFERMLQWYQHVHGLEGVAFRYFNAAGATERCGEHHRVETHLIPNVLRVALGQSTHCEIYGTDYPTPDGTCIRDYIHVVDLAEAHIRALRPGLAGVFNLGNGTGYSVREVIQTCERVTERTIRETGWQRRFPALEDMVSTAWAWHRQHPQGYSE